MRAVLNPELRVYLTEPDMPSENGAIDGAGRPSGYKPEFVRIGYNLALLGATLPRIAAAFGVSVDTVHEWKNQFPQFSDAIRQGAKDIADSNVARSLYQMALGFWGPDGNWYPPQLGAAKHWLAVRQREIWAVTDANAVNVNIGVGVRMSSDPIEAARQYREMLGLGGANVRTIEHEPSDDGR